MPAVDRAAAPVSGPAFRSVPVRRVVAAPQALDHAARAAGTGTWMRVAPDEVLIIEPFRSVSANPDAPLTGDPHAIEVTDTGWSGARLEEDRVLDFLSWATTWRVGAERPQLLQGMAAGVGVKVWLAADSPALVLVPTPVAYELTERWR